MAWQVEFKAGVWLPQIGWWLDAHFPQKRAFVSHAHSDHIAPHDEILCSIGTSRLMQARMPGRRTEHVLPFGQGEQLTENCTVTLHPAGHIFGSAQCLLDHAEHGSLLFTGDFKVRPGRSAEPCAMPHADVLVMETTFGRPQYVFPPTEQVLGDIAAFCHAALEDGETPVLFGYSLGKSQELLCGLADADLPIMLHPQPLRLTRIYEDLGRKLPPYRAFDANDLAGHVVICPPQQSNGAFLRQIPRRRTAVITGWAVDPGAIYRYQCDAAFPLSDHADFPDLLRFVEAVNPRLVLTLHGFAQDFSRTLRERGIESWAIGEDNQLELSGFSISESRFSISATDRAANDASRPSDATAVPPPNLDNPDRECVSSGFKSPEDGGASLIENPKSKIENPSAFLRFAEVGERVRATPKKLEKIELLRAYLAELAVDDAALAALFFTARTFPQSDGRVLTMGWSIIKRAVLEVAGMTEADYRAAYHRYADAGDAAEALLANRKGQFSILDSRFSIPKTEGEPNTAAPDSETAPRLGGASPLENRESKIENPSANPQSAFRSPQSGPAARRASQIENPNSKIQNPSLLSDIAALFATIAAARGPAAKLDLFEHRLRTLSPLEAKYLVKIVTGDLRIGLKEGLVEEAIAAAAGQPIVAVREANMLCGDIAEVTRAARENRLGGIQLRVFNPLQFMLASPEPTAEAILERLPPPVWLEEKYDGIRCQLHKQGARVELYSRDLKRITDQFPDLAAAALRLPHDVIIDGELLAWRDGRALPFSELQKRLGRKGDDFFLGAEIPVSISCYDLLWLDGHTLLKEPLRARRDALNRLLATDGFSISDSRFSNPDTGDATDIASPDSDAAAAPPAGRDNLERDPSIAASTGAEHPDDPIPSQIENPKSKIENPPASPQSAICNPQFSILPAPVTIAHTADDIEAAFIAARQRGNEGLMAKDPTSPYTPGRRGLAWLKLKKAYATLDVVVVGVEYGHGKRRDVLSDYTFAIRDPDQDRLLTVGKAYSGLTDVEIAQMTEHFLANTLEVHGRYRVVVPDTVLEVAFDTIQPSNRHQSGFALRFPRIARIRTDKTPAEIDTLETCRKLATAAGTLPADKQSG